jgi:AcrR family transcriptional regulator
MIEKKLKIMEKASEVFARFGIRCLTMDDLARELQISKKTIYTYFRDKDDLINQTLQLKFDQDILHHHQVKADSQNAIEELFHISRDFSNTMANIHPAVFTDLQKYHSVAFARMEKHKWEFVVSIMQDNLERGLAEGLYRPQMDVEIIARSYVAATDTMYNGHTFPPDQYRHDDVFFELLHLQVHGIASEKGRIYLEEMHALVHSA